MFLVPISSRLGSEITADAAMTLRMSSAKPPDPGWTAAPAGDWWYCADRCPLAHRAIESLATRCCSSTAAAIITSSKSAISVQSSRSGKQRTSRSLVTAHSSSLR